MKLTKAQAVSLVRKLANLAAVYKRDAMSSRAIDTDWGIYLGYRSAAQVAAYDLGLRKTI